MLRLTLARIGLSIGSKASSVMLKSVTRTGAMRDLLHTNSTSGVSMGRISSAPDCESALFESRCWLDGWTSDSRRASCG